MPTGKMGAPCCQGGIAGAPCGLAGKEGHCRAGLGRRAGTYQPARVHRRQAAGLAVQCHDLAAGRLKGCKISGSVVCCRDETPAGLVGCRAAGARDCKLAAIAAPVLFRMDGCCLRARRLSAHLRLKSEIFAVQFSSTRMLGDLRSLRISRGEGRAGPEGT